MAGTIKSRFGVVKLGASAPDTPLADVDLAPPSDTPPASPAVSAKNAFANSARPIDSEIIVRADPHFIAPSEAPRGVALADQSAPAVTAATEQPVFGDYSRLASIPVPTEELPLEIGSSSFGGYGSPIVTVTPKRFDLAGELYQRIKGVFTDPPETKSPYTLADKMGHCLVTQGLRRFFREVSKGGGEPTPIGNPAEWAVKEILPTTACRLGSKSLSIEPGGQGGGTSVTVNIATPSSLRPNTGSLNTWLSIGGSPSNPSIRAGLELRF